MRSRSGAAGVQIVGCTVFLTSSQSPLCTAEWSRRDFGNATAHLPHPVYETLHRYLDDRYLQGIADNAVVEVLTNACQARIWSDTVAACFQRADAFAGGTTLGAPASNRMLAEEGF